MSKLFLPSSPHLAHTECSALWPDPEMVLRKLTIKPRMSVVDLCCGSGLFTDALANVQTGQVFALDKDREMLTLARARVGNVVTWFEADMRALARYLPRKVDVVLLTDSFHAIPNQTTLAKHVREVLTLGGLFIVVDWHVATPGETRVQGKPCGPRKDMRLTPVQLSKIVEPSGLELIQITELPPYHYGAIFQKTTK